MPQVLNRRHYGNQIPPGSVYVGRPTKWGNPHFLSKAAIAALNHPENADAAQRLLNRYETHVRSRPDLMAALDELRGKDLACWCSPGVCHADVLLRMANAERMATT